MRQARPAFAALVLGCVVLSAGAQAEDRRLVVALYPQGSNAAAGNVLVQRTLRETFAAQSAHQVDVYDEYLELAGPAPNDLLKLQAEFLRRKYAGHKVDLVIAWLSPALDFALEHRKEIFPGVPIIFSTVEERETKSRKLPTDVIGVPINFDFKGTLDLALRLQPKTRHVFVVAGASKFDKFWESQARQVFQPYEADRQFVYLSGLKLSELTQRVAHLPDFSVIYYVSVLQEGSGKPAVPADVLEQLARVANAPIYGLSESFIGRGLVGGIVISLENESKKAAELALRIFNGERAEQIGPQPASTSVCMFDWRQLKRWGISEASLPAGGVVRNKELTFWDLYKLPIIGVLSLCVVEAVLIAGLLVQRSKGRRAELARRETENRFRQVVEAAPNGMVMVGQDGRIILVNAQVEKSFGYRTEELIGQPVEVLVPKRLRDAHPAHRNGFLSSPDVRPMSLSHDLFGRRKDGAEFPVEIGLNPVRANGGLLVLATIVDLTERKRAEQELRESETRFGLMADSAPVLIWASGTDKGCTYFNRPWLDFTGRPLEKELGNGWADGVHPDDVAQCLETYTTRFDARQPFEIEYRLRRHDGEYRWVLDVGVPRLLPNGEFTGYIGACTDVTDRRRAEENLRASQRELRLLSGRLIQAQESERRRIARELHDDLSQALALLSVKIDMLRQKDPGSTKQLGSSIDELSRHVKQVSSSVHNLSHQLHPLKLEQLGLVPAIRDLCTELSRNHGLLIDFTHDEAPAAISDDAAVCLYRIVQESARNIIKHSGARRAQVKLHADIESICLGIADDGGGFDPRSVAGNGGLGLASMRERLQLVGGTMSIDSRPSKGTRIEVRIPFRTQAAAPRATTLAAGTLPADP